MCDLFQGGVFATRRSSFHFRYAREGVNNMRNSLRNLASSIGMRLSAFVAVLVSVAAWAVPAGATGVIDVKGITESVTTEVTSNLPVILTLIGVLLAISVLIRLVRRHAK